MTMYDVIRKPSMTIVGITCRTSNNVGEADIAIPQLWTRFYKDNIEQIIPRRTANDIVALYYDYEKDWMHPYSLLLGSQVSSIDTLPIGMVAITIPEATYAIFHVIGTSQQAILQAWQHIWATPLHRTYTGDFELYSTTSVTIYVAINAKNQS